MKIDREKYGQFECTCLDFGDVRTTGVFRLSTDKPAATETEVAKLLVDEGN